MSSKCEACTKTVYPLEAVSVGTATWHKACFKCSQCKSTLTVKNYVRADNTVWCPTHVPKAAHTQVADSVVSRHASAAQKISNKPAKVNDEEGAGFKRGGGDYSAPAEEEGGGGGGYEEQPQEEQPQEENY